MPLLALCAAGLLACTSVQGADVTWYDGTQAPAPVGKLLTNNPGYWGEMIHTEISYSYPKGEPTNPHDYLGGGKDKRFGNRLLDGQRRGNWRIPVGMNGKPLIVDFDFHQTVTLNEIAAAQYSGEEFKQADVWVKTEDQDDWRKVYSLNKPSSGQLHRLILSEPARGRFVRLSLRAQGNITWVSEVWMWGDAAPVAVESPHGFLPGVSKYPGAKPGDGTVLSDQAMKQWRDRTGFVDRAVTWQVANPWQMLGKDPLAKPFLLQKQSLRQPVQINTTRYEGESAAIYLINADDHPRDVTVRLTSFVDAEGKAANGISAQLYVAGAVWTHRYGQALRPLFTAGNKLPAAQMEKYMTNGSVIKDFPTLHLPIRGTALLWITAHTRNAQAGEYTAMLSDGSNRIPVRLNVVPVTLPRPDSWVRFWGNTPASTDNLWTDPRSIKAELQYQTDMGVSVQGGWPDENPRTAQARELFQAQYGRPGYVIVRLGVFRKKLDPAHITDAFRKEVHDAVSGLVAHAKKLNLSYDQWSVELWDEPRPDPHGKWAVIAQLVKEADPNVNIYMNPLFWIGGKGFAVDQTQVDDMKGWYNQLVDISVPILGQVNAKKYPRANELFYNHQPRLVRAYYIHPCPGRMLSWEAMERDYNGWGFYAYYAPRMSAWDDFDGQPFDYQIVYPGPAGYVPTIQSESMRESWDDVGLMTLLKQQGRRQMVSDLFKAYESGVVDLPDNETASDRDLRTRKAIRILPMIRDRMLNAVSGQSVAN